MGGIACDCNGTASALFQKLGVLQQALPQRFGLTGQDGRSAVGHTRVTEQQHANVLLVGVGLGLFGQQFIKKLGGKGAHPPNYTKHLFHDMVPAGGGSQAPAGVLLSLSEYQ